MLLWQWYVVVLVGAVLTVHGYNSCVSGSGSGDGSVSVVGGGIVLVVQCQ